MTVEVGDTSKRKGKRKFKWTSFTSKLGEIGGSYKSSNATFKNRGHDISLQWDVGSVGSVNINVTQYFLQQCHWHCPSEHAINGRRYELELHMVHVSTDSDVNKIAVVGLLYETGQPDAFLSKNEETFAKECCRHECFDLLELKHEECCRPRELKVDRVE